MNFLSSVPTFSKSGDVTVSLGAPVLAGANAMARGVIGVVRTRGACAATSAVMAVANAAPTVQKRNSEFVVSLLLT